MPAHPDCFSTVLGRERCAAAWLRAPTDLGTGCVRSWGHEAAGHELSVSLFTSVARSLQKQLVNKSPAQPSPAAVLAEQSPGRE